MNKHIVNRGGAPKREGENAEFYPDKPGTLAPVPAKKENVFAERRK